MRIIARLIFAAALIGLAAWLWTVFFPPPEKVIRHRIARLADKVSFTSSQGSISRIASGEGVAGYFSTNIEVNLSAPGHEHSFAGRAEITQAVLTSRTVLKSLSVKFPDVVIKLAPDKSSAVADVTVEAKASGEPEMLVQEMKFTFQKSDEGWLITKLETVHPLN